ncbi:MAG: hypothetical protein Q4E02_04730 [Lagierella massiliensis]|nr:hypothetical protein [Lagierella massiliensis]
MDYIRTINEQRFSLHDSHIIDFKLLGNDLYLYTDYGYADIVLNNMVDGDIIIKDVQLEDSYVYIMEYENVLCGNPGLFRGEKLTLENFLINYKDNLNIDIVSDYEGYKTVFLNGYLSRDDKIYEIQLEIFYFGKFIYRVKEDDV